MNISCIPKTVFLFAFLPPSLVQGLCVSQAFMHVRSLHAGGGVLQVRVARLFQCIFWFGYREGKEVHGQLVIPHTVKHLLASWQRKPYCQIDVHLWRNADASWHDLAETWASTGSIQRGANGIPKREQGRRQSRVVWQSSRKIDIRGVIIVSRIGCFSPSGPSWNVVHPFSFAVPLN